MIAPADAIPHRGAMLLVDEVTDVVPGESIRAWHRIGPDEPCFSQARDPAHAEWPRTLVTEFLGQTAAVLCSLTPDVRSDDEPRVPLFAGAWDVSYHGAAHIHDVVCARAQVTQVSGSAVFVQGTISVDGAPIARIGRALMVYAPLG